MNELELTTRELAGEFLVIAYCKKFGKRIYLGIFRSNEEAYQAFAAFEEKERNETFS